MNIFRIIIISIVILVIFYIYQMITTKNNDLYPNKLSNCLIIDKLYNNYSIEENNKILHEKSEENNKILHEETEEECIIYEDFSNIQDLNIGINNNIKFNNLYYGLECDYERIGCFYEALINNNFKKTDNILEASLIVPCTYETTDQELSDIRKKNIEKNIFGNNVRIFMLKNTDYLVSKIDLWLKIKEKYGAEIAKTIMPYTWDLNSKNDVKDFKNKFNKNSLYIIKNNNQRQEGILIKDNIDEICNSNDKYLLVQELLQDPYLINGRKINLRVYCLFIKDANGNSRTSIYKDGFMYYTADLFAKNSKDFAKNITTGYVDRKVYEENPLTHNDFRQYLDSDRKLSDIEKYIKSKNLKLSDYIFTNIYILLKSVFEIYLNILGTDTPGVEFQLYGADIAINDQLKPLLMEINKGPDMRAKDGRDKMLKLKLSEDVLNSVGLLPNNKTNNFINLLDNIKIEKKIIKVDNYTNSSFL
jgi:hypothetical protein